MKHGLFCGDLDEVDFIEEVEERFGIAFDDADYPTWLTIGDVHASLLARLGNVESSSGKCASQMTFYRLRRAAGPGNANARPKTRLDALGLGRPSKTLRTLARGGLKSPAVHGDWFGIIALLALMGTLVGLALAALSGYRDLGALSVLGALASIAAIRFAPTYYPDGIETLGDLAHAVARLNPMILKAHGAGLRRGDIWESLRQLAAEQTGMAPKDIAPDTPFIRRDVKASKAA